MNTKPILIIEPSEINFTEITPAGINYEYVSRLYTSLLLYIKIPRLLSRKFSEEY